MALPLTTPVSVTVRDVRAVRNQISGEIIRTPLVLCDSASELAGAPVFLKLESLQRTGAFKVRGALAKVKSLSPAERLRGLVCASSGNHGIGVAYAASRFGIPCVVVVPENASTYKMSLLRRYGAHVVKHGITSDVRQEKVTELSADRHYTQIHSFADPVLIAGQGTIGLEIQEDLSQLEEVYVPIGGGGLISGVAVALKEQRPKTRIYGVEPERSATLHEALRNRGPILLPVVETVADGLAAAITTDLNFSLIKKYVDEIIIVSDRQILEATILLLERAKILVEPSGAASVAGLLANPRKRGTAVAVLSGSNITLQQIDEYRRRLSV
jgi:threonine dehydratase